MSLYETDTYCVELMPESQRQSEDVDANGTTMLLESPLNYQITNKETNVVEARSPYLPASIQIAFDLDSKLVAIREQCRPATKLGIVS